MEKISASALSKKNKATTILASVYSVWGYEVAKDIHEKEFPWDDAGIAELRDRLQHYYDLYTTTGSLDEQGRERLHFVWKRFLSSHEIAIDSKTNTTCFSRALLIAC